MSVLKKNIMTESKLQSEMVISFSQQRPDERGLLWATVNRTLSERDGQKQKAMGLFAGVSDLIYFKKNHLVCIEVKLPGSKHSKKHVQRQLDWGVKIELNNGTYVIVRSLDEFWAAINGSFERCLTAYDICVLLENSKSTVVF